MKFLITSGGTRAFLDEVRHIGNMSDGTFGTHIANAVLASGHEVFFLTAKKAKAPHKFNCEIDPDTDETVLDSAMHAYHSLSSMVVFLRKHRSQYRHYLYDTPEEYGAQLRLACTDWQPDIVILAAAVSDFEPPRVAGKISSETSELDLHLVRTRKFIRSVRGWCPDAFIVGFKLLVGSTQEQLEDAMAQQKHKARVDMVVGNDLRDIKADKHKLTVLSIDMETYEYGPAPGRELAENLVNEIVTDAQTVWAEEAKQWVRRERES